MMIGTKGSLRRTSSQTLKPLVSGSIRSSRMASGFSCRASRTPSFPLPAETTANPSNSSASVSPSTMWGSSSMIRIFLREVTSGRDSYHKMPRGPACVPSPAALDLEEAPTRSLARAGDEQRAAGGRLALADEADQVPLARRAGGDELLVALGVLRRVDVAPAVHGSLAHELDRVRV